MVINTTYNNAQNLIFQSVIVSSTRNPKYLQNADTVVIVPSGERLDTFKGNDDLTYVILTYNLYIRLTPIMEPVGLNEENRMGLADYFTNVIRRSLLLDRYRCCLCTFYDKNIDGTFVGKYRLVEKDTTIEIPVQCCYQTASDTY